MIQPLKCSLKNALTLVLLHRIETQHLRVKTIQWYLWYCDEVVTRYIQHKCVSNDPLEVQNTTSLSHQVNGKTCFCGMWTSNKSQKVHQLIFNNKTKLNKRQRITIDSNFDVWDHTQIISAYHDSSKKVFNISLKKRKSATFFYTDESLTLFVVNHLTNDIFDYFIGVKKVRK